MSKIKVEVFCEYFIIFTKNCQLQYVIGLLIYFLYGMHHSKENDVTSYSVLLSSSEAGKTPWGAINKSRKRVKSEDDRKPIIDNEELAENGYYH